MDQAAYYSATMQYLKAVKAVGSTDADLVMAQLKKAKINDMLHQGRLHSRRWLDGPQHVCHAGEDPGGIEVSLGLLQGDQGDVGRRGRRIAAGSGLLRCPRNRTDMNLPGRPVTTVFGVPLPAILGQLMLGLGQRLVLRAAEPRSRGDFRTARGGQFRARRLLHARRLRGLHRLAVSRSELLVRAAACARWRLGLLGIVIERLFLRHLYQLDPVYGLLLTFGMALIAEGIMRSLFGASGRSYPVPALLQGGFNLGFMVLPIYRAWVIVGVRDGVRRDLVPDRAHPPGRDAARGDRKCAAWCRHSASTFRSWS